MTVVRTSAGGLILISPTTLSQGLAAELAELGPVVAIVAPNFWHDLYLHDWIAAYPTAELYGAPSIVRTHRSLPFAAALGDVAPALWAADLEQTHIVGVGLRLDEIAFFHPASRTLVLTDVFLNYDANDAPFTRLLARAIVSSKPGLQFPAMYRPFVERAAFRASIERVLAWDFTHIVLGHGGNVDDAARERFRNAFAWLLT